MNARAQLALAIGLLTVAAVSSTGFAQANLNNSPGNMVRVNGATIKCIHKVQVAAQQDGLIEQLLADEGTTVSKGDTLLSIDARVAAAELAVAEKELEAAEKTASQTANVEYAKKAAELSAQEYEDELSLYNKGSGNYSQARRKKLEAERAIFGEDVAVVEHENEILAAEVAEEKVRAAKVRLDLYKVVAPYDGIILKRHRDQGEWTRAGEPVLDLIHMNEMRVEANVEIGQSSLGFSDDPLSSRDTNVEISTDPRWLEGAEVDIQVRIAGKDYNVKSIIDFVSPELEGRRIRVTARIQNQFVNGAWLLRDGMMANMIITPKQ